MARLAEDEDYQARLAEQERARLEKVAREQKEQAPLLRELHSLGFNLEHVGEFIHAPNVYDAAIPTLLKHLSEPYSDWTRMCIARSLAIPAALPYWSILVDFYRKTDETEWPMFKQGLAVAVTAIAEKHQSQVDAVMELIQDRSLGNTRVLLLIPLRKSKRPDVRQFMEHLAGDPALTFQINKYRKDDARSAARKAKTRATPD